MGPGSGPGRRGEWPWTWTWAWIYEPVETDAFYGAPYFVNDTGNFVSRSEADAYNAEIGARFGR